MCPRCFALVSKADIARGEEQRGEPLKRMYEISEVIYANGCEGKPEINGGVDDRETPSSG